MSDVRLFDISGAKPRELEGQTANIEKKLQTLMEKNLEEFFAVRFLATEYSTGKTHSGRIDTLGLDENNSPVILEYKRRGDENVITQGLYYLDWLMDHQSEFELLAAKELGDIEVDWSAPRLLCVAGSYKKFDLHATNQINRNIDLVRYEQYGKSHILFELVNSVGAEAPVQPAKGQEKATEKLQSASRETQRMWQELDEFLLALDETITKVELKYVVAYRLIQNFACLQIVPNKGIIRVTLKLDPDKIELEEGFSRSLKGVGHWGTGDLALDVSDRAGFEKGKALIEQAYKEAL